MWILKFCLWVDVIFQDGLNGMYEIVLYEFVFVLIDIICNEELILIYVEVSIQEGNLDDVVMAFNVICNVYGLGDYDGDVNCDVFIEEMLYNCCYFFWVEGYCMFDLCCYGLLNVDNLLIDWLGDQVFQQFLILFNENQ